MSRTPYQVFVNVIEARGLQGLGGNHMSDAYAAVQVGPACKFQRRTDNKPNTVNAVWHAKYLFEDVLLTEEEFYKEKICISVWSKNVFKSNEVIGQHEFSLSNIQRQKGSQYDRKWFPLTLPEVPGQIKGYIQLTMYVLRPGVETPQPEEKEEKGKEEEDESKALILKNPDLGDEKNAAPPLLLNVLVYRGQHVLENAQLGAFGKKNPFVVCRFNGNTAMTAPHVDSGNPIWNTKLVMPFNMPLTSESIEIQLWNRNKGQPDQMVGEETYNFYRIGLSHKAYGPIWVNMYSSEYSSNQVTWLGQLKDQLEASGRNSPLKSEYVGRILVRLSVTPTEKGNQRLLSIPCNPVPIPTQVEYALDILLYSSLEVPVMGGQVKVEVTLGEKRMESTSRIGKDGVFRWYERMVPILATSEKPLDPDAPSINFLRLWGPADLEQLHDIVLSVFHVVGGVTRKIAFLRLKPKSMLPAGQTSAYFANGQYAIPRRGAISQRMLTEMWSPRWYTLNHTTPDVDNPQLVAGFLLASVGFGRVDARPSSIPRPVKKKLMRFTLRCYVYQGCNLLATDTVKSSSNPFLVIRFGDASYRTRTVMDSTFPFWYEFKDVEPVLIDPTCPPSVFLNLYHQSLTFNSQIGRCEILGKHVMNNRKRKTYRYQLYFDPSETNDGNGDVDANGGSGAGGKDREKCPYVMACFQLFPYIKSRTQKVTKYPIKKDWWHPEERLSSSSSSSTSSSLTSAASSFRAGTDYEMDTFGDDGEDDNDDDDKKAEEEEDLLAAGKMTTEDLARMIYYKPVFKKYSLKVELLGLRDIKNWMFNAVSNVRMEVDFPRVDQIALWNQDRYKEQDTRLVKSYAKGFHQGRTMNINESMEWEDVNVPMDNPNGLALRFRVYQATPIGEVLLGISHTHIVSGRIIDDLYKKSVKGPDFYQYVGYYDRRTLGDEDNENLGAEGEAGDAEGMEGKEKEEEEVVDDDDSSEEEEIAEMSPELKLAMANLKDVGIELTDPREAAATKKKQQEEAEKKGGEAAAAALAAMDEEEDKKKKKAVKYKGDLDEFGNPTLDVDGDQQEDRLNNQVLDTVAPSAKKKEEVVNNEGVAAVDDDLAVKYDKDNKPYRLPMPIPVMSGKQVGYQSDQLRLLSVNSEIFWQQAALLKLFVTAVEYIYPPKPATMTDMDRERHNEARKKEDQRVREELKKANNIKWMEDNVLRVRYVSRLYVYEARHLSPRVGMFSPSETADPFLVVRNGLDPEETQNTRPVARVNSVNPEIQQVFELVTEFPKNNLLEVQVWNKDDIIGDDMIGQYTFDVEDLLVRAGGGTTFLPAKFYSLFTPTSVMTQGKLKMKLDILTEDESRRIRADEMQNADPLSYELRMVLWKTKDVRMPDEKDKDKDVDQKMFITTNFDGVYNGDTIKATDVAWFSAAGAAEWNWRMVYRFKLPCLVPRIKISMWDECVMTDSEAVGEVNYNLQPFFEQAIKDKKSVSNKPAQWIPFTHPNYPGITMGEVSVEFWLLTNIEADKQPVGEAQSEPNENPYLPMPHRNPPPWAVGSRMMDAMSGQRMLMIACALMMLLGAIAVPSVLLATKM